ncbi:DUF6354 family protein [Streptomyces sp. NPDC048281]|uniref:DUF6354 family protein n=1 Tax=Streptomyces sp. NPDC048281 TaxID=3154715 RepID=UPI00342049C6
MSGKNSMGTGRTVTERQLYRDLDRYMKDRGCQRRMRSIRADDKAVCIVEHDLPLDRECVGRTVKIHVGNLFSPRTFELVEESKAVAADPRHTELLAAAWGALGLGYGDDSRQAV